MRYVFIVLVLTTLACIEGPAGPAGPQGEQGDPGSDSLSLATVEGTIFNVNYETANADWAALPMPNAGNSHAILFVGIQNVNGVFDWVDWEATVYSDGNDEFDVSGFAGWYVLIRDPYKDYITKNYRIKYLY